MLEIRFLYSIRFEKISNSAHEMPTLSLAMIVVGIVAVVVLLSFLVWWLSSDAICCCHRDNMKTNEACVTSSSTSSSSHDAEQDSSVQWAVGNDAVSHSTDSS